MVVDSELVLGDMIVGEENVGNAGGGLGDGWEIRVVEGWGEGREKRKEVRGVLLRMFDMLWVGSPAGKKIGSWCINLRDWKEMRKKSNIY